MPLPSCNDVARPRSLVQLLQENIRTRRSFGRIGEIAILCPTRARRAIGRLQNRSLPRASPSWESYRGILFFSSSHLNVRREGEWILSYPRGRSDGNGRRRRFARYRPPASPPRELPPHKVYRVRAKFPRAAYTASGITRADVSRLKMS